MLSVIVEEAIDILFEGYVFRIYVNVFVGGLYVKVMEGKFIERVFYVGLIVLIVVRFLMYGFLM